MADANKKSIIHRLARQKRRAEPETPRLEPVAVPTVTGESIAAELRRGREDMGRDLVRIADDLKIRRVYLEAIEEGRFDDLPGATYAVGFVRAYADYLGLDTNAVVARFKEEVEGFDQRLQLVFPTPVPESKIPSGAVLLISTLLVGAAYGGWYYLSGRDEGLGGQVPDLPAALEPLVADDGEESAQTPARDPSAEPSADPSDNPSDNPSADSLADRLDSPPDSPLDNPLAPTRSIVLTPEPSTATTLDRPSRQTPQAGAAGLGQAWSSEFRAAPAADRNLAGILPALPAATAPATTPAAQSFAAAPAQTPAASVPFAGPAAGMIPAAPTPEALLPDDDRREPRVYGAENAAARVVLRARLDSWVQVHAPDDSLILTRVLQPGDSYRVPDLAGLTLVTGNAGGLQIEVDGAAIPPLGPVGAVRRDIALDPERLLEGAATSQ